MKKDIEKNGLRMLKKFQELGIDPVGIGQNQKHGYVVLTSKNGKTASIPDVKFNVEPMFRFWKQVQWNNSLIKKGLSSYLTNRIVRGKSLFLSILI